LADEAARAARRALYARATIAALCALALLEVLWELMLAPLPGGAWLALKAVPLALLFPGVARGERKPRQWLSLLAPLYFAEGITRAFSESGRHALVAGMAALVAACMFTTLLMWFRAEKAPA
jgi:uncharacterized membrane protein